MPTTLAQTHMMKYRRKGAGVGVLGIPLCVRQTLYVQTYLQLWLF